MMKRIIACMLAVLMTVSVFSICTAAVDTSFKPYEDSRYFEYGDYDIHYRVTPAQGEMKGRILMLHGFVCSTYSWRNMVTEMTKAGYECVTLDLPDFGYSTRETKDMTVIPREDIVIAFMQSIAPTEEWIVAGHSMGGGVAMNIASAVPVKALLLYCPCPQTEFPAWAKGICTSAPMKSLMNGFFKYGTKATFLVKLVIYAATNNWQFAMDYDVKGVTEPVQYDGFGAGMCEMMYNVLPTDLEAAKSISCPVLLCMGEKDIILNDTQKSQIKDVFPDAVKYTVKGGGHQCIEDRADELSQITLRTLESIG